MKIIKLSTYWDHDYNRQIEGRDLGEYRFEVNNDCAECDFWIVWGGINRKTTALCPPENVIYVTDESHAQRVYLQPFLDQFSLVLSVPDYVSHRNLVSIPEPYVWTFEQTYRGLASLEPPKKREEISVVCSDLVHLPGHKKRFAFVNRLMGHFGDRLHVYGRGFNPVENKWDAIFPYKYSIAIENSVLPNYFTEKLCDCLMSHTMPIYYGCPNVEDYLGAGGFLRIDIEDFAGSVRAIEQALDEGLYEKSLAQLTAARALALGPRHFAEMFPGILATNPSLARNGTRRAVTLETEKNFEIRNRESERREELVSRGISYSAGLLLETVRRKLGLGGK